MTVWLNHCSSWVLMSTFKLASFSPVCFPKLIGIPFFNWTKTDLYLIHFPDFSPMISLIKSHFWLLAWAGNSLMGSVAVKRGSPHHLLAQATKLTWVWIYPGSVPLFPVPAWLPQYLCSSSIWISLFPVSVFDCNTSPRVLVFECNTSPRVILKSRTRQRHMYGKTKDSVSCLSTPKQTSSPVQLKDTRHTTRWHLAACFRFVSSKTH